MMLPAAYVPLPADTMVPVDNRFTLHRTGVPRFGPPALGVKVRCGAWVALVPLGTVATYGTGLCPDCFDQEGDKG